MTHRIHFILSTCLMALCLGCANRNTPTDGPVTLENGFVNRCNFEHAPLLFQAEGKGLQFEVADNPSKCEANDTYYSGKVVLNGEGNATLHSEAMPRKLDFTRNAPIFKMMVLAPKAGAKVSFKLEPPTLDGNTPQALEKEVATTTSGEWEELVFDFTDMKPESNIYQKITLAFDLGQASDGDTWYFDEILCPSDDLTDICLFKRYEGNPIFKPEGEGPKSWRNMHIANAGILSPANSPDGNWWMYVRGSGYYPNVCAQIGLFKQSAKDFKPFGPWEEYEGNPVLPIGKRGTFDDYTLIDTAPVVGKDGVVYVYYFANTKGLCVRYSTDGGYTFKGIDKPFRDHTGCSDAVYHDGKYYIYYGGGNPCSLNVIVTSDPLSSENAEIYKTILPGGGPSNFDSYTVNGSLVFRLEGVDKWFCTYQGSSVHYDFPDRFHIAMSDDLIHWTKVENDQPLFTRGSAGEWDQGGIWFSEIFEHEGMLYMYYEGWGNPCYTPNRDKPYFRGRSRVGGASVSKEEFLKWCGLKK